MAEQTEKDIGELRDQICENLFRAAQAAAQARRSRMAKNVRQKAVAKAVAGPQVVAVKPTCPHCLQEYKGTKEKHNKKCKGKVTCPDCGMQHSKRSELRHKKDVCGKKKSKEVKPESESPKKKQKTEAEESEESELFESNLPQEVNPQPVVQGCKHVRSWLEDP
eukprot:symbB.v1.2.027344.t1/scaffold2798.1/size70082/4